MAVPLVIAKYWKPLAIALVITGAFFTGVRYKSAVCEVEKQKIINKYTAVIQEEIDRRYEISLQYEERLAEMRVQTREVVERVEVEVIKPIYRECRVPESGVLILNDAVKKFNENRKK